MNIFCLRNWAWLPGSSNWLPGFTFVLLTVGLIACAATSSIADEIEPLFSSPPVAQVGDDIWLISTRRIGAVCNERAMQRGLECRVLSHGNDKEREWSPADWRELKSPAITRPTIIYIHGNRVSSGQDRAEGLKVYRSFQKHRLDNCPVRFVIWSWPAEQISRPIKDYVVKARRTNPAAWQLAWLLDKLPAQTSIYMVGYSYGTRVVCGATQLLAGGTLGPLRLGERSHPLRPQVRAALMAAAFDADWLQPGQFYSRSMSQFEQVILATNQLDPAMRFYHLSNGIGRMNALGKFGFDQPRSLGPALKRVQRVDFTRSVGRSHMVDDYIAADRHMSTLWRGLMTGQTGQQAMSADGQGLQSLVAN